MAFDGTGGGGGSNSGSIRDITLDDLPWVLSLGHDRYGDFDPGRMLTWLVGVIRDPQTLTIRTQHAGLIAELLVKHWYPKRPECHVIFLCAEEGHHWQAASLLRRSVAWARARGCWRWHFNSDTRHDVGALARWVGAREHSPRYILDLKEGSDE